MAEYGSYEDLDPGIRDVVAWLRSEGFNTTDSGDGVTKLQGDNPYEGALEIPHVFMAVDNDKLFSEADRLLKVMEDKGIDLTETVLLEGDQEAPAINIEATYFPTIKMATITLTGVNDEMLHKAEAKKH